jgi:DNA-binding NarL/FixJ family response regulator
VTVLLGLRRSLEKDLDMARIGTTDGRLRVAVVDDDDDAQSCFKGILQFEKSFSYAAGFSSAGEALTGLPCLEPDLALVDISLPDLDGIECARRLMWVMPGLRIVMVSSHRETSWFDRSLEAGAVAYLVKPIDPAQLIATLRFIAVRAHEPIAALAEKPKNGVKLPFSLNQRERDVLTKLAEGLLYKEISEALGISYTAVHKCQNRIFRKLQVSNRSEAVRLWLQNVDRR